MILVIAIIVCAALAIAERFPRTWNLSVDAKGENRERIIRDGLTMMGVLKILLAALFIYMGLCMMKGWDISWPMYVLPGVLIIDIIVGIIRMIKDR